MRTGCACLAAPRVVILELVVDLNLILIRGGQSPSARAALVTRGKVDGGLGNESLTGG